MNAADRYSPGSGGPLPLPETRAELRTAAVCGLFVATATAAYVVEALVMAPFGPFRLGLANALVITALYTLGAKYGIFISVSRALLGSLVVGGLFSPTFPMVLGGSFAGAVAMAVVVSASRRTSPVVVSLVGAAVHNAFQLFYVYVLVGTAYVFYLAWPMAVWTIVSGVAVGLVAGVLVRRFPREAAFTGVGLDGLAEKGC